MRTDVNGNGIPLHATRLVTTRHDLDVDNSCYVHHVVIHIMLHAPMLGVRRSGLIATVFALRSFPRVRADASSHGAYLYSPGPGHATIISITPRNLVLSASFTSPSPSSSSSPF